LNESPWHALPPDAVCEILQVDPRQGLNSSEAQARLDRHGLNEIEEQGSRSLWRMYLDQFKDFMIIVLLAAAVVSGLVGEPQDAVAIVIIVLLNAIIGCVQEYRAERAVAALRKMSTPEARVRRDGHRVKLPAAELVPGDIVQLEAGNVLAADARLLEAVELRVDEASLTGESEPVLKTTAALDAGDAPLGDRRDMGYKNTLITHGRGWGIVVATGMDTEIGHIAGLLSRQSADKTPLQKRLATFGQRLAILVLVICVIIFAAGLLRGEALVLMFLTAVSLAVAAIPEALPAVVTIALALGARTMVQHHALARRLPAVETLGSVTYICADKTGTLTQNSMRAEVFYADGRRLDAIPRHCDDADDPWHQLAWALALNNDTSTDNHAEVSGDPTEVALFEAARQAGFDKRTLEQEAPRRAELAFDAERKCMTTFHAAQAGPIAYTKGAPEKLLERCTQALTSSGTAPVEVAAIIAEAERLAAEGYRVLAVACRHWPAVPEQLDPAGVETDLTFVGLVALMDPPRPEARESVALCQSAGIAPVMITGDHPATARAMAARLGIAGAEDRVLTGAELHLLKDDSAAENIETVRVYARVSPEQKIHIVEALQKRGQFVAMTGDGVNDAPALKRADIGVAMGRKGTDVAREAADMVLLDDNFATIVAAVREGRRIYDNVRKFIKYTMASNSGEIWTLFLAPFLGLPLPLLPIQILWINLVTDGLPGLALSVEPHERGIMQRPPRPPKESVFAHGMWQHMIWCGLLIGGLSLGAQAWAYHNGSPNWQTVTFTVLTLSQLVHALAIRSERESLFTLGLGSNRALLGAVLLTLALQLAAIYTPIMNVILKTTPLTAAELTVCLTLPWVVLVAVELEKWLVRQGWIYALKTYEAQSTGAGPLAEK